jgi:hypothetical protein
MTVWDFLTNYLPPLALTATGITAVVVILIGFARYGMDFIKHGFKHTGLDNSLEKRFDDLGTRIDGLHSELASIKENHFGHLKNYLTELNGILLDKNVINNQDKARLDNQLRGM